MNRKVLRFLSVFAALATLLSMTALVAFAADPVSPAANIKVTASLTEINSAGVGGTCTTANGTVTVTVASDADEVVNEVTITNAGTNKAEITFKYDATGTITNFSEEKTSGTVTVTLEPEAAYTMSISTTGDWDVYTATLTLSGFVYTEISDGVSVTLQYNSSLGSVKAAGAAVNDGSSLSIPEAGVAMVATANDGARFLGWVNVDTNERLSDQASYTLPAVAGMTKVTAVFADNVTGWYLAGGNRLYSDFAQACTYAKSASSKQVVLMNNATMSGGTFEVPAEVTFLIPYSDTNHTVGESTSTDTSGSMKSTWKNANVEFISDDHDDGNSTNSSVAGIMDPADPFRTLTVASDATLNVAGRLVIGGTIVAGSTDTRGVCGGTARAHANLQLNGTLNITGKISCCGYILGNGQVKVTGSGEIWQPLTLMDHRDGHYAANFDGDKCFPMNRYTMNNIQAPISMVSGTRLYGYAAVFTKKNDTVQTNSQFNVAEQVVIGAPSDSQYLLKLDSNASISITYDPGTYVEAANHNAIGHYKKVGRTNMEITGGASLGSIRISVYVPILGTQNCDSSEGIFPIPYNYNITLKTGTYTLEQSAMLLPGAELTVESDANLVAKKKLIVFDGFRDYAHYGSTIGVNDWPPFYYPSTSDLQTKGTLKSNGTANLIVNGTLTVNSGASFGGYVQTGGSGKVVMNGTPKVESVGIGHIGDLGGLYGYAVNDQAGRTERTLKGKLYQPNGSVIEMAAGKTYCAVDMGDHTISTYTYRLYDGQYYETGWLVKTKNYTYVGMGEASHSKRSSETYPAGTLNAKIKGSWCVQGTHNPVQTSVTKQPTCTADGIGVYTCSACGYSAERAIAKLGHDKVSHGAQAPTCTAIGWDAYEDCSRCDYTTYVEKTALGHNEVSHDAKAPTCTEIGWDAYVTCSRCDYTTYVEKTALGHDEIAHTGKAATCTEDGYKDYVTCSRCDYSTYETIGALGHDEIPHAAKAPTCTAIGWDAYETCSRCSYTTYAEKAALGHDEIAHEAQTPTCTEIGWDAYVTCSRCSYTTYAERAALGHDEIAHEAQTPTCTEIGWDAYVTCSRCDYTTYAEKAALGHNYSEEVENTRVDATCSNEGSVTMKCSRCEVTEVKTLETDPNAHKEVDIPAVEPGCTTAGSTAGTKCELCNAVLTEPEAIPAAHKPVKVEAVPASCTKGGVVAHWQCSACKLRFSDAECKEQMIENSWIIASEGHKLTKTEVVDATCTKPGNIEYWTCGTCGKFFSDSEGNTEIAENEWITTKDHTSVHVEAKEPNCYQDGNNEYWTCSECEGIFSDENCTTETTLEAVTVKATGAHNWNEGKVTTEPTCVANGLKTFHCTNGECTATKTESVPATGEHAYENNVCKVCGEVVKYKFGQSVQIGLIEPWFLKANCLVYVNDVNKPVDYSMFDDYGVYFIRGSELSNPSATQDTLSIEDILGNQSAVHYSYSAGTAIVDGSFLTANYDRGLYTYEMSDSIFVMFYITQNGQTQYAPIRERNLKSLLGTRKDDTINFKNELERNVYSAMYTLENKITAYRASFEKIDKLEGQKAPMLAQYMEKNGTFEAEVQKKYTFGNSVQIVLVEPWGLKVNALVSTDGGKSNINYANLEEYGAIVFYDTEGLYKASGMTAEQLRTCENAYVFSSKNGDAFIDGSFISAVYNKGIYTYMLNSEAYVMFYVKDGDGYHYGDVKVRNAYELAKTRKDDTVNFKNELERNVYAAMVGVYDAVTAYRDDYFSKNKQ